MSDIFVKLGSCVKQYRNEVWVDDSKSYKQITVSTTGAISCRGTKLGGEIGRKRQFVVDLKTHPNTLIFTRQTIYDGGIGFASSETDGCITTENMPLFSLKPGISRKYIEQLFLSPVFKSQIRKLAPKGAAQKSIHERELLEVLIPLPDFKSQVAIADSVAEKRQVVAAIQHEITHQQSLLAKLKQAILQEAIQGKLTADWRAAHPDVEPASQLLHRIQAEKARLIAAKTIRAEKPVTKISDDEIPFALPTGWVWCRLGSLFEIVRGSSPRPKGDPRYFSKTRTPYHWIKISDFTPFGADGLLRDTAEFLTAEGIKHSRLVGPRDIIIACSGVGSVGKSLQLSISGYIYDGLLAIREIKDQTIRDFLGLYIRFKEITIYSVASGANWLNINTDILTNYVVPLPPLAEQAAIVARVEALMTTCRALETEIEHARTHAAHLLQAVLKEAFAPAAA